LLKSDIDDHSSLPGKATAKKSRSFTETRNEKCAHHEPIKHPYHLSITPLDRSDHVVARETPLELFEFRPSSALRQNLDHFQKLAVPKRKSKKKTNEQWNKRWDNREDNRETKEQKQARTYCSSSPIMLTKFCGNVASSHNP